MLSLGVPQSLFCLHSVGGGGGERGGVLGKWGVGSFVFFFLLGSRGFFFPPFIKKTKKMKKKPP